ncbi:hypothetical protein P43SY_000394 [Pythium insidiosum]|uniref:RNA polymerase II subunit A C-terminal domain phosphatase SSU72 n=1 Tax=Pythium insidiosum TaxID=114742 RepID=A0AAD5LPU4_PYTIN|nr:hypothetical protein P43SY_000394 [Pythium insidiosum]
MFLSKRARKSYDADDGVKRNELGLVTRVRQRFAKERASETARRPLFATVCVNNVNRSMNAHEALEAAGMRVCSFGAGSVVCFPGRTATTPRIFSFSTSYEIMYETLKAEDEEHHTRTGVLKMLERNRSIKNGPQRWHKLSNKQLQDIDVVICLDSDMFIKVLEELEKLPELTEDMVKDTVVHFEKARAKQLIYVGLRV